jgi:serine/threonine protein kinase
MLSKLALKNDPHLIKLLATYRFKGHYHFLFLYAKLSLRQYWAQNPVLPWERGKVLWTIEQFLGLASALDVIHEFKSVPLPRSDYEDDQVSRGRSISTGMDYRREERFGRHGDLKPENVLWFNDQARTNNPLGILQIAGFSQGRFHQLESRSRQDPRTINGSPTYIPPELVLDRLVSRAYDIWSFGCLSLEFITWMLDGDSGVQNFSEARHVQAHDGLFDDTFYSLYNSKAGKFCEVRPGVTNWIQKLRRHQRCSQMIRDLLDLIEDRMLRVDSDDRIRSGELKACLNNILQRGQSNITYLLG